MKFTGSDNEEEILSRKLVSTTNKGFGLVINFIWILVSVRMRCFECAATIGQLLIIKLSKILG
jgi:hypothetical protein